MWWRVAAIVGVLMVVGSTLGVASWVFRTPRCAVCRLKFVRKEGHHPRDRVCPRCGRSRYAREEADDVAQTPE